MASTAAANMRINCSDASLCTASSRGRTAAWWSAARKRQNPSALLARAKYGEAGSRSIVAAVRAASSITGRPSNPKEARSSAADDSSERIPSGSGPSWWPASMTGSQRRTLFWSPERAAAQAAQCAASGWPAIRSSPSARIQPHTVDVLPLST